MPRFAANLNMLFPDLPFAARFGAAASAGFTGVEFHFPYRHSAMDVKALLQEHRLRPVIFDVPAGDWAGGERGIACLPDRIAEFREGIDLAVDYARALGCRRLNCLAGIVPDDAPDQYRQEALKTYVDNLRFATGRMAENELVLHIEAINDRDVPGSFLRSSDDALEILRRVGADNLRLVFDVYHMQIMEGDLANKLSRLSSFIGHIQIADNPGRHEPGTGEINYTFLFDLLDQQGYDGWVGCEYLPLGDTYKGLGWLATYKSRGLEKDELLQGILH